MRKIYFLFCLISISLLGQSTKEWYAKSTEAYQKKEYKLFLEITQKLDSLRPSHPTFSFNLACAYALNQNALKSISTLEKCVLMNKDLKFTEEKDLDFIKTDPKYENLLLLQSQLNTKIATSTKVIQLSEKEIHPESILYLNKSKKWLTTSIRHKKIVQFDIKTGLCSDWLIDSSLYSVFAIKTDHTEENLWATTTAIPEMKGYTNDLKGKSEILKINIKTKKIIERYTIEGNHTLGDIEISKNGDVYISDSGEPIIHKISNHNLTTWLDLKKEAFNLQGICFNSDESFLFIADYLKGILKINLNNPSDRKWLTFPKGSAEKGIDGLLFYKNSLLAIQNGVNPIRITQFFLDANLEIGKYTILDKNQPDFNEPANGFISNNKLYFIANSPWGAYDKNFNLIESKFENPKLFSNQLNTEFTATGQLNKTIEAIKIIKNSLKNSAPKSKLNKIKNISTVAKCISPKGKYSTESNTDISGYSYFKQVYDFDKPPFEAIIYENKVGIEISKNKEKLDTTVISIIKGHEFMNLILDIEKRFQITGTPQIISINNKKGFQIKAKNEIGLEGSLFFDYNSNLLESTHFPNPSNPNEIITTRFSKRKKIEGILLPTYIEIEQGGNIYIFDYQIIKINNPNFKQIKIF